MSLHNCECTRTLACEVYVCTWHRSGMVVASQMLNSCRRGPALQSEVLTAGAPVASPPCATSPVTGAEGTLICSLGLYAGRPSSPVSVPLCTPSAAFGPLSCCDAAPGRSLGSNSPSSQQHLHWQHVSQQVQFMPHCAERDKGCRSAFHSSTSHPLPDRLTRVEVLLEGAHNGKAAAATKSASVFGHVCFCEGWEAATARRGGGERVRE